MALKTLNISDFVIGCLKIPLPVSSKLINGGARKKVSEKFEQTISSKVIKQIIVK